MMSQAAAEGKLFNRQCPDQLEILRLSRNYKFPLEISPQQDLPIRKSYPYPYPTFGMHPDRDIL
jgi:hypothetical protein